MRRPQTRTGIGMVVLLATVLVVLGAASRLLPDTPPTAAGAVPRFVEEAAAAGIHHRYEGGFEFFVGGGVAAFDCDGDGRPDLYLAGGDAPAALYRNQSAVGGQLRFSRVSDPATDLTAVTGAYPLDVDSDGRIDLAVLRNGENVLLRGLGGCRFERANEVWNFDGGDGWTTAFSATWEPSATWPTLAIGNYVDPASPDDERLCHDNELIRPGPGGERFGRRAALSPGWCALSMLFSDWDRSGRRDLRISNDRHYYSDHGGGQEELWRVAADGPPRRYGDDAGWRALRIFGMGIASHDLTGDGYPEVFLTNMGDNKLQGLSDGAGRPNYADQALSRGVTAHRPHAGGDTLPSTAWHAEFRDVNNDGFVDLFIAKGNVDAMPDHAARDPNNLLLGQPDGTFVEGAEAAGIVTWARARGAALVDMNLDGWLDLVVVNRHENVELWRNLGAGPEPMGNWIALRLEQPGANPHGIGAWVEVSVGDWTTRREVTVGGGHAGGQLGWLHVGLGPAERARVSVQWPDGELGPGQTVAANGFVTVMRESSEAVVWDPAQDGSSR